MSGVFREVRYTGKYSGVHRIPVRVRYKLSPRVVAITRDVYLYSGRYQSDCVMGDMRDGFVFPCDFDSIDYPIDRVQQRRKMRTKSPIERNLKEMLGLPDRYDRDFDKIVVYWWKLTYDLSHVYDLVLNQRAPLMPVIGLFGVINVKYFSPFSVLASRWGEINSYAMEKFLTTVKDTYNPFEGISRLDYFFNCMSQFLVEGYFSVRKETLREMHTECYRFSWEPHLDIGRGIVPLYYLKTPYEAYTRSQEDLQYTSLSIV